MVEDGRAEWPQLGRAPKTRVTARATSATVGTTRGNSAVYHGFAWMPESVENGLTDAGRARELAYVRHCRLAVARTWFGSDWNMPEWGGPLQWDTVRAQAFIRWLDATAAIGCDVAINGGWHFPENIRSPACVRLPDSPGDIAPTEDDLEIFVNWLVESVRYLRVELGYTHVRYVHLFTEPREYLVYGTVPEGEDVRSYYAKVARRVATRLHEIDGLRDEVKLVAPNSVPLATSSIALRDTVADLADVIDVFSAHDYGNNAKSVIGRLRYDAWHDAVSLGVRDVRDGGLAAPFWLDEYGWATRTPHAAAYRETPDYGTYVGEAALAAMNAGAETSMLWLFADQHYVWPIHDLTNADSFYAGCHRYGLIPWHPQRELVRPGWYSFALASRAFGGGGLIHAVQVDQEGVHAGVVSHEGSDVSAVLINATDRSATIQLELAPLTGKRALSRYLVDPALLPDDPFAFSDQGEFTAAHSADSFVDVIPAGATVVFTTRDLSAD